MGSSSIKAGRLSSGYEKKSQAKGMDLLFMDLLLHFWALKAIQAAVPGPQSFWLYPCSPGKRRSNQEHIPDWLAFVPVQSSYKSITRMDEEGLCSPDKPHPGLPSVTSCLPACLVWGQAQTLCRLSKAEENTRLGLSSGGLAPRPASDNSQLTPGEM